ncbi:MAG: putative CtpA-like serine protease [Dehalococcoidia bacterium]|nr:putative CtpA-like serine protease [Chloroflexota bacterium]
MSRALKLAIASLLTILLLSIACVAVPLIPQRDAPPQGLELVEEVWQLIQRDFVDSEALDPAKMAEGAIRGLIEALDDPYTSYLTPQQYELSRTQLEGEFSGIGAIITIKEGQLTVVAPIADSPAEQAGIRPGDQILEVDGESTAGMGLHEAALKIRGRQGTKVRLLVLRPGEDTPREIEITRAEIKLPSVRWEMLPDAIAHITLTNFTGRTDSEFASALRDVIAQGAIGIVLDLRNNPGGLLDAAVRVASQFLEEGIVVYALDNRGERDDWSVQHKGIASEMPLAVLVNRHSASASEVVAGALQDYNRGPIIGAKTHGKGSMNRVHQLSNGGALYITFARWFTPDGRQIDREGITPDIEVELTPEDIENNRDPQLERAIEYLKLGR